MKIFEDTAITLTEDWKTDEYAEDTRSGQSHFVRWAFYSAFSIIPQNVLQDFQNNDGTIILTDIPLEIQDMAGYYKSDEVKIKLTTSTENSNNLFQLHSHPRAALAHELGHYVDHQLGWISNKEEWNALYKKISEELKGQSLDEDAYGMEALSVPLPTPQSLYRDYSLSSQKEFFADTFYIYCEYSDSLKSFYPDIYDAMKTCIEQL